MDITLPETTADTTSENVSVKHHASYDARWLGWTWLPPAETFAAQSGSSNTDAVHRHPASDEPIAPQISPRTPRMSRQITERFSGNDLHEELMQCVVWSARKRRPETPAHITRLAQHPSLAPIGDDETIHEVKDMQAQRVRIHDHLDVIC